MLVSRACYRRNQFYCRRSQQLYKTQRECSKVIEDFWAISYFTWIDNETHLHLFASTASSKFHLSVIYKRNGMRSSMRSRYYSFSSGSLQTLPGGTAVYFCILWSQYEDEQNQLSIYSYGRKR